MKSTDLRIERPRQIHPGFTLVELLVVISIVGVLVSLLLPAVQAVREASRKTSCKNNLKQVGLALHMYHNSYRSLPIGCFEWRAFNSPPTRRQFAWSAFVLPLIEQPALHEQIDFDLPFDADANAAAAKQRVATYECPTAEFKLMVRGRTDYGGLFGERMNDNEPDDGVFLNERPVPFKDVADGLSNTLAIAEDVGGPDNEWINGRNIFVQSGGINDGEAWIGDNEIRSRHPSGAMVLFLDGRVEFFSDSIDKIVLGQLITRRKLEVVPADTF